MYYRAFGTYLFKRIGKIGFGSFALLVSVFALSHIVNAVIDPIGALITVGYALILGTVFQWVYLKTGSLMATILLHFAVNMLG